ncbi:MAG TPA: hypothetical protein VJC39_03550 [Candidatus Nanoarchaeia archaeon]|nr:hypothetical protein [Candidatus Nanoarchaeia archaeon]
MERALQFLTLTLITLTLFGTITLAETPLQYQFEFRINKDEFQLLNTKLITTTPDPDSASLTGEYHYQLLFNQTVIAESSFSVDQTLFYKYNGSLEEEYQPAFYTLTLDYIPANKLLITKNQQIVFESEVEYYAPPDQVLGEEITVPSDLEPLNSQSPETSFVEPELAQKKEQLPLLPLVGFTLGSMILIIIVILIILTSKKHKNRF